MKMLEPISSTFGWGRGAPRTGHLSVTELNMWQEVRKLSNKTNFNEMLCTGNMAQTGTEPLRMSQTPMWVGGFLRSGKIRFSLDYRCEIKKQSDPPSPYRTDTGGGVSPRRPRTTQAFGGRLVALHIWMSFHIIAATYLVQDSCRPFDLQLWSPNWDF